MTCPLIQPQLNRRRGERDLVMARKASAALEPGICKQVPVRIENGGVGRLGPARRYILEDDAVGISNGMGPGTLRQVQELDWLPLVAFRLEFMDMRAFRGRRARQKTDSEMTALDCLAIAAMLVSGLFYFRRMERRFADVV